MHDFLPLVEALNLLLRAVQPADLPDLLALAQQAGTGMTTFKPHRQQLATRIELACASFAQRCAVEQRDYLFVLEDLDAHALVGVSAIRNVVGLNGGFYNFRCAPWPAIASANPQDQIVQSLTLTTELAGSAELCSLYLLPAYRRGVAGRLLSKSRLLFIAQFATLFAPRLIAELRGVQRADGGSPFWDGLGQRVFGMDFARADDLSGLGAADFIAQKMPRGALQVADLPSAAQQAIGAVHRDTLPARRLLEAEGLQSAGYVDIFDGGAVLQAQLGELRALRDSCLTTLAQLQLPVPYARLLANTDVANFRALVLAAEIGLTSAQATCLKIAADAAVRVMPLDPIS